MSIGKCRRGSRDQAKRESCTSQFEDRQKSQEAKFAFDAEKKFKAEARRNKLVGIWAAELLGLTGDAANSYAAEVVAADFEEAGDEDVFRKVRTDFDAAGVAQSDHQIRRQMEELRRVYALGVLGNADDDRIVTVDELAKVLPYVGVRAGQIDVTSPDPGHSVFVMLYQRERLGIVNNDDVVMLQVFSFGVLEVDLLEKPLLLVVQLSRRPLKHVVYALGDVEEIGVSLDDAPAGLEPRLVHQQRKA